MPTTLKQMTTVSINCMTCLRDISHYRKRSKCLKCVTDGFCRRCMINGCCKNCYMNKKIYCQLCHHQVEKTNVCTLCQTKFCKKCGINTNCKDCFINHESEALIAIITDIIKDISRSSISIIIDYCIGYIVTCCNKREKCKKSILFHNKYEFLMSDPRNIYRYSPKINTENTVRIYMMDLRIFCEDCTNNKLQACLNKYGGTCDKLEICGDNEYGNICGDHPFCTNCDERELKWKYQCPDIHAITRRWIYYTAPSTTINKCIICKKEFCKHCIKYNKLFCKTCGEAYNQRIMANRYNIKSGGTVINKQPHITCNMNTYNIYSQQTANYQFNGTGQHYLY